MPNQLNDNYDTRLDRHNQPILYHSVASGAGPAELVPRVGAGRGAGDRHAYQPNVEWYLRHKCPELTPWLDQLLSTHPSSTTPIAKRIRQAEEKVLNCINDLVVYVVDPAIYDVLPFLGWDLDELTSVTDFSGKTVIDIGSGTGRLAFIGAEKAVVVFAVEPVGNLRLYIKHKARAQQISNVFPVDGLTTDIPFRNGFADITRGGHVFGDTPEALYNEMKRVTKTGGIVILCPGTSIKETKAHEYLVGQGFACSTVEEPRDGMKRKYWKEIR